ncbi:hypothetical protein ACWFMI_12360 [Nocardiopsis terrae]
MTTPSARSGHARLPGDGSWADGFRATRAERDPHEDALAFERTGP